MLGFVNRSLKVRWRFQDESPANLMLSSVIRSELAFEDHDSSRPAKNPRPISAFWEPFVSLPFDDRAAEAYRPVHAELKRQGRLNGSNDLLIAATALAHEALLVTHNTREFSRVPGLGLED